MNLSKYRFANWLPAIFLAMFSCAIPSDDLRFDPRWTADYKVPLAYGKLNIFNLMQWNDSVFSTDENNKIFIIDNTELFNINPDSLLKNGNYSFTEDLNTDSFKVRAFNSTATYSFGRFVSNSPVAPLIYAQHGSSGIVPVIPIHVSPGRQVLTTSIQEVNLFSGDLQVQISSQLPVGLEQVEIQFYEMDNVTMLAGRMMPNIPANGTLTVNLDLSGARLKSPMLARIQYSSLGSAGLVSVDTNKMIQFQMSFSGLKARQGIFELIDQEFIREPQTLLTNWDPSKIRKLNFSSGELRLRFINGLPSTSRVEGGFDPIRQNNNPLTTDFTIPTGSDGIRTLELSQTELVLAGISGTEHNTLFGTVKVTVPGGGIINYNSSTQRTKFRYEFVNSQVERAFGNFPESQKSYHTEIDLGANGFYEHVRSGDFRLKGAIIELKMLNTCGFPVRLDLDTRSQNGSNGSQVQLDPTPPKDIPKALEGPLRPDTSVKIIYNEQNSNIRNYASNRPIRFISDVELKSTSPSGNDDFAQFLYPGSRIRGTLDLKIPLYVDFAKLVLSDTFDFIPSLIENGVFSQARTGELYMIVTNGFPVDATVDLILLDKDRNEIFRPFTGGFIKAAPLGPLMERVSGTVLTKLSRKLIPIEYESLHNARYTVVRIQLDSSTNPGGAAFYSDYFMLVNFTADINDIPRGGGE